MSDFIIENGILKKYTGSDECVTVPDGTAVIGEIAFMNCRDLKKVILPESVVRLESNAFGGCVNLSEAVLPESLAEVGEFAFFNCGFTELPQMPGVKYLGRSAFSRCRKLKRAEIPEGISELPRGVFFGCTSLRTVVLPPSVNSVHKNAFLECGALEEILAPESDHFCSKDGMLYSKDESSLLIVPGALTKVTVPEGVKTIGAEAFSGNTELSEVGLPGSIREIEEGAFRDCFALEELGFPDGLKVIGDDAFDRCKGLSTLVLPEDIQSIGAGAFRRCSSLMWIHLPEGFAFDLHWFADPHDPVCRGVDLTVVPFATTRNICDITSPMGKRFAGLGFILADIEGEKTSDDIAPGYIGYIKDNLELYTKELLSDVNILQWMTEHAMIDSENIGSLLSKASEGGYTAASAALLDYQSRELLPKEKDKLIDMRFSMFDDALDL